ncbi:MAG: STAS domain-containing protein [Rubrivivax sp.]|jgi:phospholipid transport system transporter-binding protein|nr:STAS domain-containing protein [Rubrivivax sp.]
MTAVTLPASVTMHDASAALRSIEAALAAGDGRLEIDASALAEADTAAVALLLHARRLAQARGGSVTLTHAPERLVALARLYGVASLLDAGDPA